MIKVQPASSRLVKSETPDQIILTSPPRGLISLGGGVLFLSTAWVILAIVGIFLQYRDSRREGMIIAGALMVPGLALILGSLVEIWRSWRLERTADALTFTRYGLFGTRVRRWSARDISSFWVEETEARGERRSILVVGFRNGRNEDVMSGRTNEDYGWLAAMLSDPRGHRRGPEQPALAAEPIRKRFDESVVPSTLTCTRLDTGVDLKFIPLLEQRKTWPRVFLLPAVGFLTSLLLYGVISGLARRRGFLVAFADWLFPVLMLVFVLLLAYRLWMSTRSGEISLYGGVVRIRENHGGGNHELKAEEIEFVQTFGKGEGAELQFLLKGSPKIRVLEGRPAQELEWVARFLRVALKGRALPEAAPLKMDAAVGDCQVCGEKMAERVVYCAKCRTPHHEECWSYVGQCSTYGCREIRFTRTS